MIREEMDAIYSGMTPDQIPWNISEPPEALVALFNSYGGERSSIVDLGCGIGNYALYLAKNGWDVTGIDISPVAIKLATGNARKKRIAVNFIVADLLDDISGIGKTFDHAFDWEVLHHIFPEERIKYVTNVHRLLKPGGSYLSVCFSEKDPSFGGEGKYRKTSIGTVLYFSSEKELEALFLPFFRVVEKKTTEVAGKNTPHTVNYFLMQKR